MKNVEKSSMPFLNAKDHCWIFAHVSGEEKDTKKKKCYVEIDVMFITWVRRKENFLTCTCIIIF